MRIKLTFSLRPVSFPVCKSLEGVFILLRLILNMQKITIVLVVFLLVLLVFGCITNQQQSSDANKLIDQNTGVVEVNQLCGSKTGNAFDSCVYSIAKDTKSSETCNKIIDASTKDMCFQDLAGLLNDSKLCNSVIDQTKKSICLAVTLKDSKYCDALVFPNEDINTGLFRKNACYLSVSLESLDQTLCVKVNDSISIQLGLDKKCEVYVQAYKNKDSSFCAQMGSLENIDYCYGDFAVKFNDKTVCDKIVDSSTKETCLNMIK